MRLSLHECNASGIFVVLGFHHINHKLNIHALSGHSSQSLESGKFIHTILREEHTLGLDFNFKENWKVCFPKFLEDIEECELLL